MLGADVSEKYAMTVLKPRAKRSQHKNTPRAIVVMQHDQIVQNDEENAFSSYDESKVSINNALLNEFQTPAEV